MGKFQVGLLNFSENDRAKDHMESIQELIDYAKLADQLGFSRFWLGEHYLYKRLQCWTNPEMLIPIIACCTDRIRLGIAGSLINIHQSFDIATNYKLLANLFPSRIDLGFAKGRTEQLQKVLANDDTDPSLLYFQKAREIINYFTNEKELFDQGITLSPVLGEKPQFWLLGSSYKSLDFALELGANFSKSLFHLHNDPNPDINNLKIFQENYYDKFGEVAQVNLAVAVCCSNNPALIRKINKSVNGNAIQYDPKGIISGTPSQVHEQFCQLHEKYNITEFILLQLYDNKNDRIKGIELISNEFGL